MGLGPNYRETATPERLGSREKTGGRTGTKALTGGTEIDTAITNVIDLDFAIGKRRPASCCIRDTTSAGGLDDSSEGGYAVRPARRLRRVTFRSAKE
ncbi:MAG: hypothetical protein KJ900_00225 [Proteobacteria bacterium]|nr:hypothetical protein [Desulfocapsa sp.]MBU3944704.1 hypothetical protein [Pseudomonadota bacterium]MCG2745521.1 hypothetical protein [Desulfobacteraceae bacterium]MBU4029053.1 hypothetical protein [Pseudomonadota bacterium]MBU4041316.1 hypothetical protein [Pseudomonadota bacterium]